MDAKIEFNERIKNIINEIQSDLINIRRDLHRHPELSFEEYRTSEVIYNMLNELGLEVERGIAKTGIVGTLKGEKNGSVIALRADMDALPIKEKNQISFASREEGKMHACGHDGHITILLGVAMVLSRIKNDISGTVKFIFQPAEEDIGGAQPMIEQGVLEQPKVDRILGLHIWPDIETGQIGIKDGPTFASIDEFDLTIKGNSSHGASPHQGIDAILIAAEVINSLQTIVSRQIDPTESAVITVGKIEGGYRRNVIADEVKLEGTVRTVNPEVRIQLEEHIKQHIKGVITSYEGKYDLEYRHCYPPLINDKNTNDLIRLVASQLIGKNNVIDIKNPTLGGEDFAYFLEKVPGSFFFLGGKNKEKGIDAPNHNPYFNFDESIMVIGVEIMVQSVLNLL